jgi:spore coat polysaccharide biosynthesis predicted glycosyltransferase SpsG
LSTAEVRLMLGPSYTLLREEFVAIGAEIVLRDLTRPPQALVVFLGGADVDNLTMHVVEQLVGFKFSGSVHVLLGQMNSNRQLVQAACTAHGFDCRLAGQPLGSILIDTRLAVVACGMFAVELQAMGIPCVLVPLSPIQHRVATHFTETGNALLLSQEQLCNDATLSHLMKRILEKSVTRRPLPLLDGARLVIESLLGISHEQTKDYLPSSHR